MAVNYEIEQGEDGRWITKGDGITVGIHKIQQEAIVAARKKAWSDRAVVSWKDSDGCAQRTDFSQ